MWHRTVAYLLFYSIEDVEEAGLSSGKRMGRMLLADDFVGVSESRASRSLLMPYMLSAKYGFGLSASKPQIHALRSKSEDHIPACAICRLRLHKPDNEMHAYLTMCGDIKMRIIVSAA